MIACHICQSLEKCLKYLKSGWNRKEGRGNKDFKKGGQIESRSGYFKGGGGGWNPLTNFVYCCVYEIIYVKLVKYPTTVVVMAGNDTF